MNQAFQPVVANPDLSIIDDPEMPWLAVVCRWKDAHRFRKTRPELAGAAVVGPLRTVRGVDLLIRGLLANPQIRVVLVEGVDLTPGEETTEALRNVWATSSDKYLSDDVKEHADLVRRSVTLTYAKHHANSLDLGLADRKPIVLPPPRSTNTLRAPHGDPSQRVVGDSIADVWPLVLHQAMRFGRTVPTQYGDTREYLNLVSVIRYPQSSVELPDWVPDYRHVDRYSDAMFRDPTPLGDFSYSYSSRLHGTPSRVESVDQVKSIVGGQVSVALPNPDQMQLLDELLIETQDTRAAYVTPWRPAEDAGKESGRPCLVGAWFRAVPALALPGKRLAKLHGTVMFRSHDLFGGYPLNLAAICNWLVELANRHGMTVGTLTCISCSAHVYAHDWVRAEQVIDEHFPSGPYWDQRTTWVVTRSEGEECPSCGGTGRIPLVSAETLIGKRTVPEMMRCGACGGVGQRDRQIEATALTADGKEVVATFTGATVEGVRAKIERSGLIQSVGGALWLGSELERVGGA